LPKIQKRPPTPVHFRRFDDNHVNTQLGSISWGSINEIYCQNDIKWYQISKSFDYAPLAFKVDKFQFGQYQKKSSWYGTLDSSLSVLIVPDQILDILYRTIPVYWSSELQLLMTDCDQAEILKDFVFTIGGNDFQLPAKQYIIDVSDFF
jgi:hypothetical protein